MIEKLDEALRITHKMAEDSMKLRWPNFTLDQIIEQEELFQQGLELMEAGKRMRSHSSLQEVGDEDRAPIFLY